MSWEPLPCPRCGEVPEVGPCTSLQDDDYYIEHTCPDGDVTISTERFGSADDAVRSWNTRAYGEPGKYIDEWHPASVAWLLQSYEHGALMRDCDLEAMVLIACEDRDALIRDMLSNMRCRRSCADCPHEEDDGCEYMRRALEIGVDVHD